MAEIGAVVEATVERVMDYGAFVKLPTGESGLVHISEVDRNYVRNIHDHVHEGDTVTVKIVGQKEDGRIELSIKQAQPGYEDRPRKQQRDPDFERKLKRFMSQSQERLVDLKRHREGKR
ncbi:MAG: binding domain protein [Actinomycetota bacterium]|jgi:S1 RNA binding domain protein|nr:binding domain protein [Actinomycetota bacterium]MEA2487190.1 binding domain protein [Actinomycetota bacterium]